MPQYVRKYNPVVIKLVYIKRKYSNVCDRNTMTISVAKLNVDGMPDT